MIYHIMNIMQFIRPTPSRRRSPFRQRGEGVGIGIGKGKGGAEHPWQIMKWQRARQLLHYILLCLRLENEPAVGSHLTLQSHDQQ